MKPENFLIKRGETKTIYIVDFGLAKLFMDRGKHIECVAKQHFIGTAGYSSLNSHKLKGKLDSSRADRAESQGRPRGARECDDLPDAGHPAVAGAVGRQRQT